MRIVAMLAVAMLWTTSAAAQDGSTFVVWIWGQSLAANVHSMMTAARPPSSVYMFQGQFAPLVDPVWGAGGTSGSWMPLLADELRGRPHPVTGKPIERVVVLAGAQGATRMRDWSPGGMCLPSVLGRFREALAHDIVPDAMIYQQGEADAADDVPAAAWRAGFTAMLASVRELGVTAPLYVPLSTYCRDSPGRAAIRAAQWSVADGDSVRHGPDFDKLVPPIYRYDRCHLTGAGQDIEARAWADTLAGSPRAATLISR